VAWDSGVSRVAPETGDCSKVSLVCLFTETEQEFNFSMLMAYNGPMGDRAMVHVV
jgi:hypothetical protein